MIARNVTENGVFDGQVVVVTGAAQGIGVEVATQFADSGATVVMVDIQKDQLHHAAQTLRSRKGRVGKIITKSCDLTDEASVHAIIGDIIKTEQRIDVLAHLAGAYWTEASFLSTTSENYRRMFQINVDPCFFLAQAVLPHMQKQGYGRIIFTASKLVVQPVPGFATYTAAKNAVVGFARGIAREVGDTGSITVNVVVPTLIATKLTESLPQLQPIFSLARDEQIVKRTGRPDDVASAMLYLASPAASFVTGQMLHISGGATM